MAVLYLLLGGSEPAIGSALDADTIERRDVTSILEQEMPV